MHERAGLSRLTRALLGDDRRGWSASFRGNRAQRPETGRKLGPWASLARLLAVVLAAAVASVDAADFLPAEQAFRLSAGPAGESAVRVHWDIADGYYLYQKRLRFDVAAGDSSLGEPILPPAETKNDKSFGQVPVYRRALEVRLPVTRQPPTANELELIIGYQGCADAGFCYPPQKERVRLQLPAALTPGSVAAAEPRGRSAGSPFSRLLSPKTDDALPPVEKAFQLDYRVTGPNQLRLTWRIAPGTYLYRHLIDLSIEPSAEAAIADVDRPAGERKTDAVLPHGDVGEAEVYLNQVDVPVRLTRASDAAQRITLIARYQGCASIGVCYPPQLQRLTIDLPETGTALESLPAATSSTPPTPRADAATAVAPVAEQDLIAATLANSDLWAILVVFFGFGLLLSFTPCVFPMIPILSGIIVGHGVRITTRRALALSVVYVLAMAVTYTVAGILAGLFGANLQAFFQNPWILGGFALIFVLLALSMFGFYDLQLPPGLQTRLATMSNRQQAGTLLGAAIMGLLSALIVGPCVAPPLFGALLYIGQTGDAVLGGVALFALSLGMGAPLIIIGASAGKLLPRAGVRMDAVKAVFGVALLGVAILLLERLLPVALSMTLWGLLFICSAVYMGALTHLPPNGSGWSKLWKGLGVVLLIYGALMLLGAAAGGKDTLQPLRGLTSSGVTHAAEHVAFERIKTGADLDRAVANAKAQGRPAMLDFYADWCVSCKELERDTFSDPRVAAEMRRFVLLQADVTANDAEDQALMQDRFGIIGPPAMLFFDTSGQERKTARLIGFVPADRFAEHLRRF